MRSLSLLLAFLLLLSAPVVGQQARLLVSGDWLEENLTQPDLVVLHASRDGSDYEMGHIPGARLVLLDRIAWEGETGVGVELRRLPEVRAVLENAGVSDRSRVVVYGSSPMVAARLWMTVDVVGAGSSEPLFLDGGLQVWKAAGRPISTERPVVEKGKLILKPRIDRIVSADWILVRLGHDGLSLVDARLDDAFSGADDGLGGRLNPGHIPSARQLAWEDLVESRDHPVFLPADELLDHFVKAGADPGETVVTYCHTGLRASVDYMIARMLGYKARLFDGSWSDWGSRDYPHFPRRASEASARYR